MFGACPRGFGPLGIARVEGIRPLRWASDRHGLDRLSRSTAPVPAVPIDGWDIRAAAAQDLAQGLPEETRPFQCRRQQQSGRGLTNWKGPRRQNPGKLMAQGLVFPQQAPLISQCHLQALLKLALKNGRQLLQQFVQGMQLFPSGLQLAVQIGRELSGRGPKGP
jgi:hypothetical protein